MQGGTIRQGPTLNSLKFKMSPLSVTHVSLLKLSLSGRSLTSLRAK